MPMGHVDASSGHKRSKSPACIARAAAEGPPPYQ
jgi:hypothetical protein